MNDKKEDRSIDTPVIKRRIEEALSQSIWSKVTTHALTAVVSMSLTYGLTMTFVVKNVWKNTSDIENILKDQQNLRCSLDSAQDQTNKRILALVDAVTASTKAAEKQSEATVKVINSADNLISMLAIAANIKKDQQK